MKVRVGPEELEETISPRMPERLRRRMRNDHCEHYDACLDIAARLHWRSFRCCWEEEAVEENTLKALGDWAGGRLTKEQLVQRVVGYYLKGNSFLVAEAAREVLSAVRFVEEEEGKGRERREGE